MRYTVRKSVVDVIGGIWMPYGATCAMRKELSAHDVENARDEEGRITRESVAAWVDTHSGDFSSVIDFSASIEDGEETVDLAWQNEESEGTYNDCMYPCEE